MFRYCLFVCVLGRGGYIRNLVPCVFVSQNKVLFKVRKRGMVINSVNSGVVSWQETKRVQGIIRYLVR
jgi:hypothetical protein